MNKIKNIKGCKFGLLTVLNLSEKVGKRKELYWDCLCECGNLKCASGDNIKKGSVKSCGCLLKVPKANKVDLSGIRFERLLVLFEVPKTNKSTTRWQCICDCGNIVERNANDLKKGHVKSCGCLQRELASTRRKVNQLGSKNSCFNPNLTDEDRISRRFVKGYKEWSFSVKQKYNFTCYKCGDKKGGNLVSHHLFSYMKFKDLRLDPKNGVCLCELCHNEFHNKYGWGDNTEFQFNEWIRV